MKGVMMEKIGVDISTDCSRRDAAVAVLFLASKWVEKHPGVPWTADVQEKGGKLTVELARGYTIEEMRAMIEAEKTLDSGKPLA